MYVDGSGITTPLEFRVLRTFKPRTELALSWDTSADGNYYPIDRGVASDYYDADLELYGTEATISAFIDTLEENRTDESNVLYFYDTSTGEKIFGANIDNSQTVDGYAKAFKVTVISFDMVKQGSLKGFGVSLKVRNLSPSFIGSATLPALYPLVGYIGDSEYTINKVDSYDNTFTYQDHQSDSGVFECGIRLADSNAANLKEFVRQARGAAFNLAALGGVANPFGRRSSSFPYSVRVIDLKDMGLYAVDHWQFRLKIVEQI